MPLYECGKIEMDAYLQIWENRDRCLSKSSENLRSMPIYECGKFEIDAYLRMWET